MVDLEPIVSEGLPVDAQALAHAGAESCSIEK